MAICKCFDFNSPVDAAVFIAEVDIETDGGEVMVTSNYSQCLQDFHNFQRINAFLSLLQTNLK